MKNSIKNYLVISALLFPGASQILYAQSAYKITTSKENDMKLSGTSTLHDWSMSTETLSGSAQFKFKAGTTNQLVSIKSLTFSLHVLNLKSGESALDENAYKALNTDQYSEIFYHLQSAKVLPSGNNKYLVKTIGNLIVAGKTKRVAMDVYCLVNSDGTITSTGTYKLKMTDYNVEPPSFLFGAMKTGDEITLDFNMVYKLQSGI